MHSSFSGYNRLWHTGNGVADDVTSNAAITAAVKKRIGGKRSLEALAEDLHRRVRAKNDQTGEEGGGLLLALQDRPIFDAPPDVV